MNGISLVNGSTADVVEFVLVLQQPSISLYKSLGEPAVQPFADGGCAELATLLDHHLQRVGQLKFAPGADVVIYQVLQCRPERLDVLDVVDADDGLVAHEFLRLFHEPFDATVLAGYSHTEASGILHLIGVQHVLAFARESPEVRVEQGVAEYYEQGLVVACVGEREAYCLPQALRVALEYGAGLAPFGLARQVAVHGFGLVAGDEDGLGGGERSSVAHDPVDDGLSADG